MNQRDHQSPSFLLIFSMITLLFVALPRPVAGQSDEPTPQPTESAASLQATIEAQEARIAELEADWDQVLDEQELALERAIFVYFIRPMAFIGAILIAIGIVLAWRSLNEIPQKLNAFETKIDLALAENRRDQQARLNTLELQRDRMMYDIESRLLSRAGEIENHYSFRIQENASKTLDIVEGTMLPIRLPRGHNLGDLYNSLQAGGYENITWYDALGDTPFSGVTLVYIRSNDDASRLLTFLERSDPKIDPRASGFLLYAEGRPISPNILGTLQKVHLNLTIANNSADVLLQLLQLAHGLKREIRSPGL